jgi:hypothetical protein
MEQAEEREQVRGEGAVEGEGEERRKGRREVRFRGSDREGEGVRNNLEVLKVS